MKNIYGPLHNKFPRESDASAHLSHLQAYLLLPEKTTLRVLVHPHQTKYKSKELQLRTHSWPLLVIGPFASNLYLYLCLRLFFGSTFIFT